MQFPLQQSLLDVHESPTVGLQMKPVRQRSATHRIVKLQSLFVRHTPPSTAFAMQAPWKHAYEQQSACSPQAKPTGLQVEATASISGSPLMRHPETAARTRVARIRFRSMAGPLEPVRDAERRGEGGELRSELQIERDRLEDDAPARGHVGREAEPEPRDEAGRVLAALAAAVEHLRAVVALERLAEPEATLREERDARRRGPEDARGRHHLEEGRLQLLGARAHSDGRAGVRRGDRPAELGVAGGTGEGRDEVPLEVELPPAGGRPDDGVVEAERDRLAGLERGDRADPSAEEGRVGAKRRGAAGGRANVEVVDAGCFAAGVAGVAVRWTAAAAAGFASASAAPNTESRARAASRGALAPQYEMVRSTFPPESPAVGNPYCTSLPLRCGDYW